jgi:hypothetical protein
MLNNVTAINIIITLKLINEVFFEPILSIISPSNNPPKTSPKPRATRANNTFESLSLSEILCP